MANVFDVAEYILQIDNKEFASVADLINDGIDIMEDEPKAWPDVTPMKLQKLVYYVKGFSLVLLGRPIFGEKLEAWRHGPVCPDLYHRLKSHGASILSPGDCNGNASALSQEERELRNCR
jgi:uncharacterized phage-associated protein